MRVGLGFDVHPFVDAKSGETKPLILGGITLEGEIGLEGHSDADVVAHSCSDALLGAASLGDLGEHFPDTDPSLKGVDSIWMLEEVVEKIKMAKFSVANLNCVVIADKPKIAPYRNTIQEKLESVVGAPVSIGGKRTEGTGFLEAGKGIACFCVALLTPQN